MAFPGERDLRVERALVVETFASLTDEEFESGPTLCEGWAPRDVLAHLIGFDTQALRYVRALGRVASLTPTVAVWPWRTDTLDGEATMVGAPTTVIAIGVDSAEAPRLSYARAASECCPTGALAQETLYGEVVSVPISVVPL